MKSDVSTLSIKMSKEEMDALTREAEKRGEKRSGYCRRILMGSIRPLNSDKDVMMNLLQIGYVMSKMTDENYHELIPQINERGAWICQTLSSR